MTGRVRFTNCLAGWMCLAVFVSPLLARDYFVDQKHPQADDKNPGTEDKPFKTIQPAVDAAKVSETVYVKAGVYGDVVKLRSFGNPYHPNTLTAWKDDRRDAVVSAATSAIN